MKKEYLENLMTRKIVVQAIYSSMLNFLKFRDFEKNKLFMPQNEILFFEILNQYFLAKEKYINNTIFGEYNISFCAKTIIICALIEFELKKYEKNLIINEYLQVTKMFCPSENSIINKLLDIACY